MLNDSDTVSVIITRIDEIPINQRIIKLLTSLGIKTLFPPQERALETGVLNGRNLILAIPTSSGKTLVAEICMLKSILSGNGKAMYLVPLRSLAFEKHNEFKKYDHLGIKTAISVGDFDTTSQELQDADIIILTTERADSLIRHGANWLPEIGIVVVDEIHLLNDPSRGPTLEMVVATILNTMPNVQIVALSATISNADAIAHWLDAELVKSTWRPISLREGVYFNGNIMFDDGSSRPVERKRNNELANLVCSILDEDGQVLVFVSSRRSTISVARILSRYVNPYVSDESREYLRSLAQKIGGGRSIPETSRILARTIMNGVAFHHAGLSNQERILIENAFKSNHLKVITATPTLAAGVNLPARRVIIRDYRRYESSRGNYPIPVLEYKQMSGRAGRPKYDSYGESVLIAKSEYELDSLMEQYVLSEPEEITSKLASQKAMRFHLLALISSKIVNTTNDIDSFLAKTFFSSQFDQHIITEYIQSALDFLENSGLIHQEDDILYATSFGKRTSDLYIDPESAILFRDILSQNPDVSEQSVIHLICHSPDQPVFYLGGTEVDDYSAFVDAHGDEFLVPPPDYWDERADLISYLAEIKTSFVLLDWMDEQTDREITERYNIGVGDIHRFAQIATWLLYSASEIARISASKEIASFIRMLSDRMKHGVRSEILELVRLKGIGRVRARMLYNHGVKSLSDLLTINPIQLARIPTIGTTLARSILKQVGIKMDEMPEVAPEEDPSELLTTLNQTSLDDHDI